MDSIDLEVLKTCDRWIHQGLRCELVTVIKTWGSSPRPEGATLGICEDGRVVGSVSGGCIEEDLIYRVRKEGITQTVPNVVTYGVTSDEARRFGLPCGGTIQLSIEPLTASSNIDELLLRLSRHELVARHLDLKSGSVALASASAGMSLQLSADKLVTIHGPRWRLLIIGAGQLSRFLAQIAVGMDYQVIVCDPREEYREGWEVPGVEVSHAMPDDLVVELNLDNRSAVVALTHDPKLDDMALMEALKSNAFYVGAIGSRLNNTKRRARLKDFDVADAELDKLHAPIGIYIGSKTPSEIAISILAEMTASKNGVQLPEVIRVGNAKTAAQEAPTEAVCGV
ncbi:putative xanthine dehydrogenase subunit A [mine drainage metagenome]|uniref:Putative xanthine dehydrogenase subunit A n=1 Tax=mine drainage metagenome TaxID=410659 RepID=A0A1J5RRA1_9ZZZZ